MSQRAVADIAARREALRNYRLDDVPKQSDFRKTILPE
jgi:hypothetical protein